MNIQYRAHTCPTLMAGYKPAGLTEAQARKMDQLRQKLALGKELTPLQEKEYIDLSIKITAVPELTKTPISCIVDYWVERNTGRRKIIQTKEMLKGILTEDEAIGLYRQKHQVFVAKNTKRVSLGLISGEADILDIPNQPDLVPDIKVAWDLNGFMKKNEAETKEQYYWQLVAYAILYDKKVGQIAWCLTDLPEAMIQDEVRKIAYVERLSPETSGEDHDRLMEIEAQLTKYYTYPDLAPEKKVKTFTYEIPEEDKKALLEQLEKCKQYELGLSI